MHSNTVTTAAWPDRIRPPPTEMSCHLASPCTTIFMYYIPPQSLKAACLCLPWPFICRHVHTLHSDKAACYAVITIHSPWSPPCLHSTFRHRCQGCVCKLHKASAYGHACHFYHWPPYLYTAFQNPFQGCLSMLSLPQPFTMGTTMFTYCIPRRLPAVTSAITTIIDQEHRHINLVHSIAATKAACLCLSLPHNSSRLRG